MKNGNRTKIPITVPRKVSSRMMSRAAAFDREQVRDLFDEHGCVVAGHPEMGLHRDSWCAMEKADLACEVSSGDQTSSS